MTILCDKSEHPPFSAWAISRISTKKNTNKIKDTLKIKYYLGKIILYINKSYSKLLNSIID